MPSLRFAARLLSSPRLAAPALAASLALLVPAAVASGKRPLAGPPAAVQRGNVGNGEHGNGNGHGNGHGSGRQQPAAQPSAPAPASVPGLPAREHGGGQGHGSGHGHGNALGNPHGGGRSRRQRSSSPPPGAAAAAAPAAPAAAAAATPPDPIDGSRRRARTGARDRRLAARGRARRAATARRSRSARAIPHRAAHPAARGGAPARPSKREPRPRGEPAVAAPDIVVRTIERVVERIPRFLKALVGALVLLALASSLAWALLARTARYLRRQRAHLLGEIGVLQGALLPSVPAEISRLEASVAYRPAEGLAAGGDFYDAFPLEQGRVGIVVGDVAGHGKEALMHTALLRYTLRAYLEAGLEPRLALALAGRALDRGFETLATVVLAEYDPVLHVLRYASAGHPPPVFLGAADHVPVTRASAPPIGAGLPTGVRQTTVALPSGSAVCFFTDGLIEARRGKELIGRLGLVEMIRELGPHATAEQLLERVAREADRVTDDMAACMFRVADGPDGAHTPRVEEIEVHRDEPLDATLGSFLAACGVAPDAIEAAMARAARTVRQFRGAVVRVSLPRGGPRVEVQPANVERLGTRARRLKVRGGGGERHPDAPLARDRLRRRNRLARAERVRRRRDARHARDLARTRQQLTRSARVGRWPANPNRARYRLTRSSRRTASPRASRRSSASTAATSPT